MSNSLKRTFIAAASIATTLTSCVVVPVGSDGTPIVGAAAGIYPAADYPAIPIAAVPPYSAPAYGAPAPSRYAPPAPPAVPAVPAALPAPAGPAAPAALQARLYPANEAATETGLLSGTVTNMMTGKGVFQLNYRGEVLTGEATRVPGDDRRGVASAYGQRGTYMSCDYRMTTPYQGTGTCSLSNGAQYQVHIGG
jgi:hypothetical protein